MRVVVRQGFYCMRLEVILPGSLMENIVQVCPNYDVVLTDNTSGYSMKQFV